ncbi:CAP domain-containing protein [Cellulomonas sp. ES6]|uniref:CAP domain-containing protein n=1 Tax=Cellulomonas sp. ES6 TaxID=3039384 RepID=UPI00198BB999|nr:CAP domain-containing protein [Cellulomonas sp. ES6]MBD3779149.1 CAP domain-containing protein [Micrococcales bacterium]WHP18206.1 CAP domain-containing protein [Cellulomonas sp. ES6]
MRQRLRLTSTLALAGLLAATGPAAALPAVAATAPAVTAVPAATKPPVTNADASEKTILQRTNALRSGAGKRPLVRSAKMDAVAAAWATRMATTGDFRHNPSFSRQIPSGWRMAGENIAMNSTSGVTLYTQWKNSAPHRANMLNASYNRIGIGAVKVGNRYYGVQVFGAY